MQNLSLGFKGLDGVKDAVESTFLIILCNICLALRTFLGRCRDTDARIERKAVHGEQLWWSGRAVAGRCPQ